MPPATYKIAEARAPFSELLPPSQAGGEDRESPRGTNPTPGYCTSGPAPRRDPAPLEHLRLPDDLFEVVTTGAGRARRR